MRCPLLATCLALPGCLLLGWPGQGDDTGSTEDWRYPVQSLGTLDEVVLTNRYPIGLAVRDGLVYVPTSTWNANLGLLILDADTLAELDDLSLSAALRSEPFARPALDDNDDMWVASDGSSSDGGPYGLVRIAVSKSNVYPSEDRGVRAVATVGNVAWATTETNGLVREDSAGSYANYTYDAVRDLEMNEIVAAAGDVWIEVETFDGPALWRVANDGSYTEVHSGFVTPIPGSPDSRVWFVEGTDWRFGAIDPVSDTLTLYDHNAPPNRESYGNGQCRSAVAGPGAIWCLADYEDGEDPERLLRLSPEEASQTMVGAFHDASFPDDRSRRMQAVDDQGRPWLVEWFPGDLGEGRVLRLTP